MTLPVCVLLHFSRASLIELEKMFLIPIWINDLIIVLIFFLMTLAFAIVNLKRKQDGQDFRFFASIEQNETKAFKKATYPQIEPELLKKRPKDLVLGKFKNRYVCVPVKRDGINAFVTGTPGAGKSVMIKNFLLSRPNFFSSTKEKDLVNWNFFLVDVDGLIYKDVFPLCHEFDAEVDVNLGIKVIEPSNRNSFGFDVFYALNDGNFTETKMLKVANDIAEALIPETKENPYFSVNARRIFRGVLIWGIKNNMEFIDIVQELTRNSLDELLTKIIKEAKMKNLGLVLDSLKNFENRGDNESVQDIESTLKQYLDVLSFPEIVFALKDNPHKVKPSDLNDVNVSVILSIETSMLSAYSPFFRLVSMMFLRHIESDFKVEDERNTIYIFDEAARIGKVNDLDNTIAIARKYHVSIILFYQDIQQISSTYGKEDAAVLRNLCELKIFMSGSGDSETTNFLKEIVGDYVEENKSYSKKSLLNNKTELKFSEDRRPIINGKSLMSLRDKQELIIIYFGKYFRFKKVFFFNDRFLKKKIEQIKKIKINWEN